MSTKLAFIALLTLPLIACAATPGADDTESSDGTDDALTSAATSYAFTCKNADATKSTVVVSARADAFDIRATTNGATLFTATAQRPSLSVRLDDSASANAVVNEFVDFSDAGLQVVPVDGPNALEIDLAGAKTLLYKTPAASMTLSCSFDKAKLLGLLKLKLVAASRVNLTGVKAVAFDIDDTLAFTTPTFTRGFATGGTPAPTDTVFWTHTNGCDSGCNAQSITLPDGTTKLLPDNVASTAKSSAIELVKRHKAHGHKVYAITARPDINGDPLRHFIEQELGIAKEDVFFEPDIDQPGNPKGKADRIKALDLDVFYGDSDSDITDAKAAFVDASGAATKPIQTLRFLRSPKSSNRKAGKLNKYHPGYFGESIITGSYE
ncbi:MAG: hypothetical protein KIT84_11490 [Labilithrix sp.]|nr:hypothetical protein [Labilithrix sp.]MCW5811633.1 hypothetical protein [Labilithrix sp.]